MTTITLLNIQSASLSDLKAFAKANDIFIEGDKRKKASFVDSIEAFLIESGDMEAIAAQANIANDISEDITLDELEATQAHYETILPSAETSEPVAESKLLVKSSAATPLTMLYPLAMVIIAGVMASGWLIARLGVAVNSLVVFTLPYIDQGFTTILEGVVWLTELLFGSEYDEYSDSYLEIKHLMRS